MSSIAVVPHLRVLGSDYDPADEDEFEGWGNYLDYHIGASDEPTNNMYIGTIITEFISRLLNNPEMFWKIEYYEIKTIVTTGGGMNLPGITLDVTEVAHDGSFEQFSDRNSDGYFELNRAIPVYEQFPRFLTEHDTVVAEPVEAADAENKPKSEAAPGEEVEGEDEPDDTLHVSDGDVITVYDELGHEQQVRISVV